MFGGLGIARPLSQRDFRLLWAGQSISLLGDGVFTVALAWQAYELSPRPATLSVVLLARSVPMLALLLFGGVVTDRFGRRQIMLSSDVVRGAAVGTLAILAASGSLELWHLIALSAAFGAADAFFFPAFTAFVPELLAPDLLLQANALESAVRPLAFRLAGPALGGLLVAQAGTASAFATDAATFAVGAGFLLAISPRAAPERGGDSVLAEIKEGYRYTRSQPWIWVTLVMAALAVLVIIGPLDVLMPLITKQRLHSGAQGYGFIIASMGAGGIAAAVVAAQLSSFRRRVTAMYLAWAAANVLGIVMALSRALPLTMAAAGAAGFGFELGLVFWVTLLQELVPGRLLGRVRSLDYLVSFALVPVSYGLTGPVAGTLGAAPTLAGGCALGAAVTFAAMFWPRVRDPDRAPAPPVESEPAAGG